MSDGNFLEHRVTSLERWGMRGCGDFQADGVALVREAGFTGVFVNGGAGIGPDQIVPESMVVSEVIPDLMPLTVEGHEREVRRRCALLAEGGVKPWLCLWGVPGPDDSAGRLAESSRYFDRRTKLEMRAKLERTPEIFGYRNPKSLNWRGSRPLCVSHPQVQAYYRDLMPRLLAAYPAIEGIFFFPGDNDPEICDETCPRCRATGLDRWDILVDYVNLLYEAVAAVRPDFPLYFTFWNLDNDPENVRIGKVLARLNPGVSVGMSISDNSYQERKSGVMMFNQPWVLFAEPGEQFLSAAAVAREQGRAVMVLGELGQAEEWDPVCHNVPNPAKVLDLLGNANGVPAVNAVMDFYGHRGPYVSHANFAAMRAWFDDPGGERPALLRRAAVRHYGLAGATDELVEAALAAWAAFDEAVDDWALAAWSQRFSFAIGRDGARGPLYRAILPMHLRGFQETWAASLLAKMDAGEFCRYQGEDRLVFLARAGQFDELAEALAGASFGEGARLARREARNIELAGELLASEGRWFEASAAFEAGDFSRLRAIVLAEIDGRERQLEISGRIGYGGGVNALLVSEDIQNMRLFLSHDAFPNTPEELFSFTETPYTV